MPTPDSIARMEIRRSTQKALDGNNQEYLVNPVDVNLNVPPLNLTQDGIHGLFNDNYVIPAGTTMYYQIRGILTSGTNPFNENIVGVTAPSNATPGTADWVKFFYGNEPACQLLVCEVLSDGSFVAAGKVDSQGITIEGTLYRSNGQSDILLVKFNSAGLQQWVKHVGSSADDVCYGMCVDSSDNIIITGYCSSGGSSPTDVDFGGTTLTPIISNGTAMFAAKYHSNGTLVWAKQYLRELANTAGWCVKVDSLDNPVIVGSMTGRGEFQTGTGLIGTAGARNFVLAKLNKDTGDIAGGGYAVAYGGGQGLWKDFSMVIDGTAIYVSGNLSNDVNDYGGGTTTTGGLFLARYSLSNGAFINGMIFPGCFSQGSEILSIDPTTHNILITGRVAGSGNDFGGGSHNLNNNPALFMASYSSALTYLWDKLIGGGSSEVADGGSCIRAKNGKLVVGGLLQGQYLFGTFQVDQFIPGGGHLLAGYTISGNNPPIWGSGSGYGWADRTPPGYGGNPVPLVRSLRFLPSSNKFIACGNFGQSTIYEIVGGITSPIIVGAWFGLFNY